jgi:hypothetical protein
VNLIRGLYLIFRSPERFEQLATEDAARLPAADRANQFARAARDVRRGLGESFGLVVLTVVTGWLVGEVLEHFIGSTSLVVNHLLQYGGVGIILWATLAIRGWSIQTSNGNTLPERLDRAIYRALYLVGSFLLVLSVAWPSAVSGIRSDAPSAVSATPTVTLIYALTLVVLTLQLLVFNKQRQLMQVEVDWRRDEAITRLYQTGLALASNFARIDGLKDTNVRLDATFDPALFATLTNAGLLFAPLGGKAVRHLVTASFQLNHYIEYLGQFSLASPGDRPKIAMTLRIARKTVGLLLDKAAEQVPPELRWKHHGDAEYNFVQLCDEFGTARPVGSEG